MKSISPLQTARRLLTAALIIAIALAVLAPMYGVPPGLLMLAAGVAAAALALTAGAVLAVMAAAAFCATTSTGAVLCVVWISQQARQWTVRLLKARVPVRAERSVASDGAPAALQTPV